MANFDVTTSQIDAASVKIQNSQNLLKQTQQTLQESMGQARSVWRCDYADRLFGDISKALNEYDKVVAFAGSAKACLTNASDNYTSNEEAEVDLVKKIQDAYS